MSIGQEGGKRMSFRERYATGPPLGGHMMDPLGDSEGKFVGLVM